MTSPVKICFFVSATLLLMFGGLPDPLQAQNRPNVIHIFADDLGWGSVGFNNSITHIQTPNIDAIASAGMILHRSYASTVCSPSRDNLLTGFHNGHGANDRNQNIGTGIRTQDVTTGEVLTGAGYHTAIIGKWGWGATGTRNENGPDPQPSINQPATLPANQGFAEFFGYLNHSAAHDFYYDYMWQSNSLGGSTTTTPNNGGVGGASEYSHDLFGRRSEQFVRDNAGGAAPFYLQLNYTIPHFDHLAIASAPALLDLDGNQIFQAGIPAVYANDSSLSTNQKRHAAMISRMDASIGRLIASLADPNGDGSTADSIVDNTLVIFSSDNGATPEDGLNVGDVSDVRISGGLRGGKRDLYEGGIRVPSFAYWPGKIQAGSSSDILNDLSDFQATAAELAETSARVGIDGVSILPTLLGQPQTKQRDFLIFENILASRFNQNDTDWTIIRGDHKLIKLRNGSFELYDIVNDPTESSPLNNASLVSELEAIALAEGVGQPDDFAVQLREWHGNDGGSVENSNNWEVTDSPTSTAIGSIDSLWSALVRNTTPSDAVAIVGQDISTLGFEVSGDQFQQAVEVSTAATLDGRNEVRVGNNGTLQLNKASVSSGRWVEILAGGVLTGEGNVESNLLNQGVIEPGFSGPPTPITESQTTVSATLTNPGFESGLTGWTFNTTTGASNGNYGGLEFPNPPSYSANVAELGSRFLRLNSISTRDYQLTQETSNSIVEGTYNLSVALGDRLGAAPTDFRDSPGVTLQIGFVSSGTFTALATNAVSAATINAQSEGSLDDFSAVATVSAGSAAIGSNLAVRIITVNPGIQTNNNQSAVQAGIDNVRLTITTTSSVTPPVNGLTFGPEAGLEVAGDFQHGEAASLDISFSGTDNSNPDELEFDYLDVVGDAFLAGNLNLTINGNPQIQDGDEITFLNANSITGEFENVEMIDIPGFEQTLVYTSNAVSIQFAATSDKLLGDVNLDGVVNFLDISALIAVLTENTFQCEADLNSDGVVNFLDIAPFIGVLANQ